jgi:hypothetical protein
MELSFADQIARIDRFNEHLSAYRNSLTSLDMYWVPALGDWKKITSDHLSLPGDFPQLGFSGSNYLMVMDQWADIVRNHDHAVWDPRTGKWWVADAQTTGGTTLPFIDQMNRELDAVNQLHLSPGEAHDARMVIIKRYFGGG